MKKAGIPEDVYTFNALLSACEKGDQWEEALKVWLANPQTKANTT
jgi:hypothetical protein